MSAKPSRIARRRLLTAGGVAAGAAAASLVAQSPAAAAPVRQPKYSPMGPAKSSCPIQRSTPAPCQLPREAVCSSQRTSAPSQ